MRADARRTLREKPRRLPRGPRVELQPRDVKLLDRVRARYGAALRGLSRPDTVRVLLDYLDRMKDGPSRLELVLDLSTFRLDWEREQ